MSIELVHLYRGNQVESIHRGDIVCVDQAGHEVFSYGDSYKETFWRSSAKPFQVVPFIRLGGLERFKITTKELSLMTSSHSGEADHVRVLQGILDKMDKQIEDLDCGTSRPIYEGEYIRLLQEGIPLTAANNPCSGKHSHMLGLGIIKGFDLKDYILPEHPIQQMMLEVISEFTEVPKSNIHIAIDGCGVPVFGLPIYNMALAFSKLALEDKMMETIAHAMTTEPFYVAGTKRLDTVLMEETGGRILAKLGAESVYCMTDMPSGHGIAMKIEDGSKRALFSVVPVLLKKHQYISQEEYDRIMMRLNVDILNHRKQTVGYHHVVI
jgi:L-asparaginase II